MLDIRNTLTKMKNAFEGLSRLNTAEKRISELAASSTETSKTQSKKKKKDIKNPQNIK